MLGNKKKNQKSTGNVLSTFQKNVLNGKFYEALTLMNEMNLKEVEHELIEISIDDCNIMPFAFLMFVLNMNKKASICAMVANLLIHAYNVWDGSYVVAQMYAEEALALDENCIEALAIIMELATCPDSTLTKVDMINARKRIEKLNPNHPYLQEKVWY